MRAEGHNPDHRIDELERRASLGLLLEQTSRSFKRFSIAHQHDRISGTEAERRIASVEGFSRAHDGDDDRPGDSPQVQRDGILAECRGPVLDFDDVERSVDAEVAQRVELQVGERAFPKHL